MLLPASKLKEFQKQREHYKRQHANELYTTEEWVETFVAAAIFKITRNFPTTMYMLLVPKCFNVKEVQAALEAKGYRVTLLPNNQIKIEW